MACHCNEFSRAHLLRSAAAEAGRGLPPIERGMPLPAGTGLNRRSFMLRAGLGMLSVYGASKLGLRSLQEGIAKAQGAQQPVLVTVFMDGGMDSLSVLAPTEDPLYQSLRPTLKLGSGDGTPFTEDATLRWHPRAAALDNLHRDGKVTVLPAVGYDGPDQSHFTSRHYWEVGELDPHERTGWMGRLLDQIGTDDNPLQGLSLDGWLSPSLATANRPVAAIDGSSYDLWAPGVWGDVESLMYDAAQSVGRAATAGGDAGRTVAGRIADQSITLRSQLQPFGGEVTPPVPYPESDHWFPRNLAALAAMLDAGLPIRCVSTNAPGGYDTHDNQLDSFGDDIGLTFDTLAAFQADLEARGLAGRVLTLVYSEFGRRPEQNGSGTDHGAAGAAFVMGSRVQGEMVGEFRGLDDLDEDDNLRHSTDFRTLYCSLLEQWFDVDAAGLIPGMGPSRYQIAPAGPA
jgi:uncharacterized protein (DUF1501 family)